LESVTFSFEGGPNLNFAEGKYILSFNVQDHCSAGNLALLTNLVLCSCAADSRLSLRVWQEGGVPAYTGVPSTGIHC
jgi:hypothetical protein